MMARKRDQPNSQKGYVQGATDLPASIGPVQFGHLGGWITVRCPRDLDPLMRRAGGNGTPARDTG
jgi:hypothetical protein